jgi:hypothetical protein
MEKLAAPYEGHWLEGVVDNGRPCHEHPETNGFTLFETRTWATKQSVTRLPNGKNPGR